MIQQQAQLSAQLGAQIQALQRQAGISGAGTPPKGGKKGKGKQETQVKGTKRVASAASDFDELMGPSDSLYTEDDEGDDGCFRMGGLVSGIADV